MQFSYTFKVTARRRIRQGYNGGTIHNGGTIMNGASAPAPASGVRAAAGTSWTKIHGLVAAFKPRPQAEKRMMNTGKTRHLFIAAVLLLYLLSAKPLYDRLFIRQGRPEGEAAALPAPAMQEAYIYRLAALRPVRHEGQDLLELRGFVFPIANPQMKTRIRVVLSGPDGTLLYSSSPAPVASMLRSFHYPDPVAEQAEFRALIAKQFVPLGTYRVGLLLEAEDGTHRAYLVTNHSVVKTPNQVRYHAPQ